MFIELLLCVRLRRLRETLGEAGRVGRTWLVVVGESLVHGPSGGSLVSEVGEGTHLREPSW